MNQEGSNLSLKELSLQEENQKCFECDKSPANWASVNNGIFLCYDCANEHKVFGSTLISMIKSTTIDMWNENHVKLMRAGGNFRLKIFLETYGFPSNISKKEIYSSKLISFYRRRLKTEATGEEFNETIPSKQQYWESFVSSNPMLAYNEPSKCSNEPQANQNESSSSFIPSFISSGASSLWGSVWGTTTTVASAVKNKLNESEVGSKILTVGGNTIDAITSTGSKMYEKSSEMLSQTGSKIMEKGSELYETGKEKTVAGITYTSGIIYEKGTEIIQGEIVKNIANQAGNSMIYIKDKIASTIQEANQEQPKNNSQ